MSAAPMHAIGFVGLGIMGRPMARALMAARSRLTVLGVVPEAVRELVADAPGS